MKKTLLLLLFATIGLNSFAQKLRFNKSLNKFCEKSISQFDSIPAARKEILNKIAEQIAGKKNIVFTCYTNSRRTQLLQTWAQTAFYYYGIFNKTSYSYGDSVSEIAVPAIKALKKSGFLFSQSNTKPKVWVFYISESFSTYAIYPKATNQVSDNNSLVISVCMEGEKSSTLPVDAMSLPYMSPIKFENTDKEKSEYEKLNKQIAIEMLYIADKVAAKVLGK